uniref:Transmembrane protein n=1 Tax=Acrobeloides nanus TaxID=290746 RepID=A0A914CJP4_9BILA
MSDSENDPIKELGVSCCVGICNIFISMMPFIGFILLMLDNIPVVENHEKIFFSIFVIMQIFFIIFECTKFFIGNGLVILGILSTCCSCVSVYALKEASTDENDLRFSPPILQVFQFNNIATGREPTDQNDENSVIIEEVDEGEENQSFIPAIENNQDSNS